MKHKLRVSQIIALVIISSCNKQKDLQFCFTSIAQGSIDLDAIIGKSHVPCGFLSAYGGSEKNQDHNFDRMEDLCGAIVSGYRMALPDSAKFKWSYIPEGTRARPDLWQQYQKEFALPPYPKLSPGEMYQVGFCIGYQDCVYVRIETIPKH